MIIVDTVSYINRDSSSTGNASQFRHRLILLVFVIVMAEAADQLNISAVRTRATCRELFAFTPIKIVVNLVGTRPL